jgi:hypothetical protein
LRQSELTRSQFFILDLEAPDPMGERDRLSLGDEATPVSFGFRITGGFF